MDNNIKIFYEQVIPEALNSKLLLDLIYSIGFSIIIEGKRYQNRVNNDAPTIVIRNIEEFNNYLLDYLNVANLFYENVSNESHLNKAIMATIWSSATSNDLEEPIPFLKRFTNFIKDKTFENIENAPLSVYVESLESELEISIVKNDLSLETPYSLSLSLKRKVNNKYLYYHLPNVHFGISDGIAYIYGIQNINSNDSKFDDNNEYIKEIKRKLNKVNKGFASEENDDNIEYPENITGITPAHLLSLIAAVALLKSREISTIKSPVYMPIRYEAMISVMKKKLECDNLAIISEEKRKRIRQELEQQNIPRNMIDKFIRYFRRLEYVFSNIKIEDYPNDFDNSVSISIDEYGQCNNELLNDVYCAIINTSKIKKGIRNKYD